MGTFPRASRVLDAVQNLAQLDRFDPEAFAEAAREELGGPGAGLLELAGQLDGLRALLAEIDGFAQKAMRIRLTRHADVLPQQLRSLFQTTVLSYERDLPLLRARVGAAMARMDPAGAGAATDTVVGAAEATLAVRARLRERVLELAPPIAAAWLPVAQRAARDRSQPDEQRDRWKRAVVDLEQVAASGTTLEAGAFDARLAAIPTPEDPPEEEKPHRFELLELD